MGHCKNKICLKVIEIDLHKKSTAKNKFGSRSSKSTSIRRALQKLNLPQGQRNRPHQRRHPQRGRNKTKKESLKSCLRAKTIDPAKGSALQKINLPQGHRNRPHLRRHPQRARIKIQRRA